MTGTIRHRKKQVWATMLSHPVLIIESDDWGPSPEEHAKALESLRKHLLRHLDANGHPAVMTIGIVLSIPDMASINSRSEYAAHHLRDPAYAPLVETLKAGAEEGVFHLQLHGLAHYWPANLMAEIHRNPEVAAILEQAPWNTEKLPSWLQSRWLDSRELPSRSLPETVIDQAVAEEVEEFELCFGFRPKVAVPPTFVWNDEVERAYARHGIEVLITPGRRFTGREAQGQLTPPDRMETNGGRLSCGLTTLVRDIYFEPSLGHSVEKVLDHIEHKWARREPALLETHRFNFIGKQLPHSLDTLDALITGVLERNPDTRFMSPPELVHALRSPEKIPLSQRVLSLWRRIRQ